MRITKKLMAILMLLLTIFSVFSNIIYAATEINEAYLQDKGDVDYHLQFWNEAKGGWYYVTTTYVTYTENGQEYPAYCLNRGNPGVGEYDSYTVDIDSVLDLLMDKFQKVVTTTPDSDRAISCEELKSKIEKYGKEVVAIPKIEDAVQYVLDNAEKDEVIIAAGSLYMIGHIRSIVK